MGASSTVLSDGINKQEKVFQKPQMEEKDENIPQSYLTNRLSRKGSRTKTQIFEEADALLPLNIPDIHRLQNLTANSDKDCEAERPKVVQKIYSLFNFLVSNK